MWNKAFSYLLVFIIGLIIGFYVTDIFHYQNNLQKLETEVEELRNKVKLLKEENIDLKNRLGNKTTIVLLPDREYFNIVKKLIIKANKSIYIAVYSIKYDPKETIYDDPVNMFLKSIVEAHNRGILIKILVDDQTYSNYPQTIEYLKKHGIEIRLDPKKNIISHMKIVIIDSKWIIIGSHNWTESALWHNHEYSVLIRNQYYAKKVEQYFNDLWESGRKI